MNKQVYKDLHKYISLVSPGTPAELLVWLLTFTECNLTINGELVARFNEEHDPQSERNFFRKVKVLVNKKALIRVSKGEYRINPAIIEGSVHIPLKTPETELSAIPFLEENSSAGVPDWMKAFSPSTCEQDWAKQNVDFYIDQNKDKTVLDRARELQNDVDEVMNKINQKIDRAGSPVVYFEDAGKFGESDVEGAKKHVEDERAKLEETLDQMYPGMIHKTDYATGIRVHVLPNPIFDKPKFVEQQPQPSANVDEKSRQPLEEKPIDIKKELNMHGRGKLKI